MAMKILAIEKEGRLQEKTDPAIYAKHNITYVPVAASDEEKIAAGKDAEIIIVDAMGKVSADVINAMPKLKLIHSDGVGFQGVDIKAAKDKGVYVCNCKSMNAAAVAEQAILLMLGLLRDVCGGNAAVHEGQQIKIKEDYMLNGSLKELGDCTIGLYGFGDIAKKVAQYAGAMGADIIYYDMFRASGAVEERYNATYVTLDELLRRSDIVSIHVPVTPDTVNVVNKEFLAKMRKDAFLVNTARGELVDSEALVEAIRNGVIAGAGLDTISGEPVTKDNPIAAADEEVSSKMILSCHIGGISNSSFTRGFQMLWDDITAVEEGKKPERIVNGL